MTAQFIREKNTTIWRVVANNSDGSMVEWCADSHMRSLKHYNPKKIWSRSNISPSEKLYKVIISFKDEADEAEFIVRAAAGIYPYGRSN